MTIKQYFSFTPPEVTCAFQHARQQASYRGIKILHAPLSCSIPGLAYGKLLIITPRACGKAHDRNRIKRQLRAIFYEEKLYTVQSLWILLVRKDAMKLSFDELKTFLRSALTS